LAPVEVTTKRHPDFMQVLPSESLHSSRASWRSTRRSPGPLVVWRPSRSPPSDIRILWSYLLKVCTARVRAGDRCVGRQLPWSFGAVHVTTKRHPSIYGTAAWGDRSMGAAGGSVARGEACGAVELARCALIDVVDFRSLSRLARARGASGRAGRAQVCLVGALLGGDRLHACWGV